mmetsp:Transcript_49254/g.81900  ORF Transcript_49254/g.81900 Transcript_49254/m.81900 type:complete len:543 (+) Transcript_49254:43-1671(+)
MDSQQIVEWICFACIMFITWFILYPILLYYIRKFHFCRQIDLVSKRNPTLTLSFSLVATSLHLLSRTYFVVANMLEFHFAWVTHPIVKDVMMSMSVLWLSLLNCVLWATYYDWKKSTHLLKSEWKEQLLLIDRIKPDSRTKNKPWTLKHGKVMSNPSVLLTAAVVYWMLLLAVQIVLTSSVAANGHLIYDCIMLILVLGTLMPILLLGCATSKLYDTLGIKSQFRMIAVILYVCFALMALNLLLVPFSVVRVLLSFIILAGGSWLAGLRLVYISGLNEHLQRARGSRQAAASRSDAQIKGAIWTFSDIWKSKALFQIYANHCAQEYTIENLLFIVEFEQLVTLLRQHYDKLIDDAQEQTQFLAQLMEIKSAHISIADKILGVDEMRDHAFCFADCIKLISYLYDRYIDSDSPIEINISSMLRSRVVEAFAKHNLMDDDGGSGKSKLTSKTRKNILPLMVIHSFHSMRKTSSLPRISGTTSNMTPSVTAAGRSFRVMIIDILTVLQECQADLYTMQRNDSWPRFLSNPTFEKFVEANPKKIKE